MMVLVELAWGHLWQHKGRSLLSIIAIALGCGMWMAVLGLGVGVRQGVLDKISEKLPFDTVEVEPRQLDLGPLRIGKDGLFGQDSLDATTVARLRQMPHVRAVFEKAKLQVPLGARGGQGLIGRRLYTDLFVTALPEELLAEEVSPEVLAETDFVPVLISEQLIDMFNRTVAPTIGAPGITKDALVGFEFELVVGQSLMMGQRGRQGSERARIVGTSRYALRLGATVPMKAAQRLIERYGAPEDLPTTSLLVRAREPAHLPDIVAQIESAGLSVDEGSKNIGELLLLATFVAGLLSFLILALAGLNIAHSFFASLYERRVELAILRAMGLSQARLVLMALIESLILGLCGGAVGALGAGVLGIAANQLVSSVLAHIPFAPDRLFAFPWWIPLSAIAAGGLAALFGALLPSVRVARSEVARVLAEA